MKKLRNLNIMAIAAPHWVANINPHNRKSLNSTDPFSLQNALRFAGSQAQNEVSFWGSSNWKTKQGRKDSIFLFDFFEDNIKSYVDYLHENRPNLIFIGAMTLSFPGAVSLAKYAKDILRDDVFIVLGGKHSSETILKKHNQIKSLNSSPLKLMSEKKIPNCFDLIISGDGEDISWVIGEIIGEVLADGQPTDAFFKHIYEIDSAKGDWIAGWLNKENEIKYLRSSGDLIDYDKLSTPAEVFGITSKFSVFNSDVTAHSYSDMSKGCVYDCFFCSERSSVNGKLKHKETAPQRLYNQFKKIIKIAEIENQTTNVSTFVEDSILLGGRTELLSDFAELLENGKLNIKFGAQFTIDSFLRQENLQIIECLRKNGLEYILFGIETINESVAIKMSKNAKKHLSWIDRVEEVIKYISIYDLKCCFCILWGLGETQTDRINQLLYLKKQRKEFGVPQVISLNWATLHPLQQEFPDVEYDYCEWGTSKESPYLPFFIELFGEASEKYLMPNVLLPSIEELKQLRDIYLEYFVTPLVKT